MGGRRVELSILSEELQGLINASAKIFPVPYSDISGNVNPNNHEYSRVSDMGTHKNEIYVWTGSAWELIGADDKRVNWGDLINVPITFSPSAHTHTEANITDLDKYKKSEVDDKLNTKANSAHTHSISDVNTLSTVLSSKVDIVAGKGLSTHDYTDDDKTKLDSLTNSATVDYSTMNTNLTNHTNDTVVHVTSADHTAIGTIGGKADKSYVDTALTNKADSSTLSGHTGNTTIHVTQTDKDTWNGKANVNQIPTTTSQLTNNSGFLTNVPNEITVDSAQPTSILWYKVVG